MEKLYFGNGNTKLQHGQRIFDLPAGHSCPFALGCRASADRVTGKIKDGKQAEIRCYAASLEGLRSQAREKRWDNFEILRKLKASKEMIAKIMEDLPFALIYRIHSSGDFFSQAYFDSWVKVAERHSESIFYAYTKAIPFWIKRIKNIPKNFILNASYGGKYDSLIKQFNLKSVQWVWSVEEAQALGLEIDTDDTHAWRTPYSFAVLVHGAGKAGSAQARMQYAKARGI